jgi:hypothetical protein
MADAPDREFAVFQRGEVRELILALFRNALRSQTNPDTGATFTEEEIAVATAKGSKKWVEADADDIVALTDQQRALWLADQVRIDRAGTSWLQVHHGPMWGESYLLATGGSGPATATGTAGTVYVGSTTVPDPAAHYATDPLDILGRLTKNLKFCFDSDEAGLRASRRAGEAALQKGFRLKIIALKNAKDPDELIKKSPGYWEKAVSEAIWFLDYYIQKAKDKHPQDALEQKHYLSAEVVPFLKFIADPLEQDHYINELVKNFGISEKVIRGHYTCCLVSARCRNTPV